MENRKGLGRGLDSLLGIFDKKDEAVVTKQQVFDKKVEKEEKKLDTTEIDISLIDNNVDQPRKNFDPTALKELADSINENGLLEPLVVRKKENGRYEMLSGHRRKKALELIGATEAICNIKDLSDEEAIILMVDSNIYREKIFPSEKAYAYKMKLEAMKHQGKKSHLYTTCVQVKVKRRVS